MILATDDSGKTWTKIPDLGMPLALAGEGAFAASGTCLVVQGDSNAWFGTGGGATARVFRSTDRGRTWAVADTPIRAGSRLIGRLRARLQGRPERPGRRRRLQAREGPGRPTSRRRSDGGKTWKPIAGKSPRPASDRRWPTIRARRWSLPSAPAGSETSLSTAARPGDGSPAQASTPSASEEAGMGMWVGSRGPDRQV